MKIVAKSLLGHETYFINVVDSWPQESSTFVKMCSDPKQASELTQEEASNALPKVQKCYPSAVIRQTVIQNDMIPVGTRVRFTKHLYGEPTGDHPAFLFANVGDEGVVMRNDGSGIWPYSVKRDKWLHASFKASSDEFVVIEAPVPEEKIHGDRTTSEEVSDGSAGSE